MKWRWDQGRLEYFQFENIVRIAGVLSKLDGVLLNAHGDPLRGPLEQETLLPFAPKHYKVWRNYARVFSCAMLATRFDDRLVVTDLCRELAKEPCSFSSDQYFNFVFSRFALPYAAFEHYDAAVPCVFPFVAVIKFIFSRPVKEKGISLDDVFSYVIGNGCTGLEDLNFYANLPPTGYSPQGDERRQVREMLVFMGQSSFLKLFDRRLYADTVDVEDVLKAISPKVRAKRCAMPEEEFLAMTSVGTSSELKKLEIVLADRMSPVAGFAEGRRVFGIHGKLERSPLVRKHFFRQYPNPVCDACNLNVKHRYPWTDNILELHHVLPLSSTINVNGTTTLLEDMVPLCPSCHKSIHAYYRIRLAEWGIEDFDSKQMAKDVYNMAKGEIVHP